MRTYLILVFSLLVSCTVLFSCQSLTDKQQSIQDSVEYLKLEHSYIEVRTMAHGLKVPWGMDYVNNRVLFTEIEGNVKELDLETGKVKTLLQLHDVFTRTTPGLLDIAIEKTEKKNPFVFINYTKKVDSAIVSSLVRYQYTGDTLINPKELLTVRGANGHNGSRLLIDKNNILYWATGDVANNKMAQDSTTLNGKVLRMTLDGSIPKDNPIPNSLVYAWGFRNIQGMAMNRLGNLFTAEHGDAIEDEINWVRPLHNYGWPLIEGGHDTEQEFAVARKTIMTEPMRAWTPVIAPAGLAYYNHSAIPEWQNALLLVTLKSQSLRVLTLNSDQHDVKQEHVFFTGRYGRLRAVLTLPNGDIFLSTSNRDWNPQPGFPKEYDDRIIRLRIHKKKVGTYLQEDTVGANHMMRNNGVLLYQNYCASCHKPDGKGVDRTFPSLVNSSTVKNMKQFSMLLLRGTTLKKEINGVRYEQDMASFSFLKDEELVSILNYVSKQFGNKKVTTVEELKNLRKKN